MIRKFIELAKTQVYDHMHVLQPDGSFKVDKEKDGQTTSQHRAGIDYIKSVLQNGQKIMPILVRENSDGTYLRLDGFKRAIAQWELGYKLVEAFVCTQDEYDKAIYVEYGNGRMRAWHGGQFDDKNNKRYDLLEGEERPEFKYDDVVFLYKSPNPAGLRIEVADTIHVHWSDFGRYRFTLGRRDFEALATAISQIDG